MTIALRIGFMPLVDSALLVAAQSEGFAEAEGLAIELVREVSWANIRDRLNVGLFDAAHMLAPAAIATHLGLGQVQVDLAVPVALNLNGNAVTLSRPLAAAMAESIQGSMLDPAATARALAVVVARRAAEGAPQLTLGHVFPYSTHHYQLRLWLQAGGLDPDRDLRLVVLPPPYMVASLANGQLDGFCVGAPWNNFAVRAGIGEIVHLGCELVRRAPEKVLAVRAGFDAEVPETVERLVRAVAAASAWCSRPDNRDRLAGHVVAACGDMDAAIVARLLAGQITVALPERERHRDDFLILGAEALPPDPAHAEWLHGRMVEAGQARGGVVEAGRARAVYRLDRFAAALGGAVPLAPYEPGVFAGS